MTSNASKYDVKCVEGHSAEYCSQDPDNEIDRIASWCQRLKGFPSFASDRCFINYIW